MISEYIHSINSFLSKSIIEKSYEFCDNIFTNIDNKQDITPKKFNYKNIDSKYEIDFYNYISYLNDLSNNIMFYFIDYEKHYNYVKTNIKKSHIIISNFIESGNSSSSVYDIIYLVNLINNKINKIENNIFTNISIFQNDLFISNIKNYYGNQDLIIPIDKDFLDPYWFITKFIGYGYGKKYFNIYNDLKHHITVKILNIILLIL